MLRIFGGSRMHLLLQADIYEISVISVSFWLNLIWSICLGAFTYEVIL